MHLFHKWSKWSEPFEVQMIFMAFRTGTQTRGIEHQQRRTCSVCGEVQERTL